MQDRPITLRHRLEYVGFRAAGALVRALPLETASDLSGFLWRTFAPLLSRHPRSVANLRAAFPDKSEAECDRIARAMWDTLGRIFAEGFRIQDIVSQGRLEIDPQVEKIIPADRRFVAAAAHQGNWELAVATLQQVGGRGAGIYQRIKNPLVENYIHRMREPLYPGGLWPKQDDAGRRGVAACARWGRTRHDGGPSRPQGSHGALLRAHGADLDLPRARLPHDRRAAVCGRDRPPPRRALHHRAQGHRRAAHVRPAGRHQRGDGRPSRRLRGFHPAQPGTMDVGAQALGMSPARAMLAKL